MDTCGLERVERFRINLNEKNFASRKNTLTSSLPQRCRAVGTYSSGNDTLVNVSHVRAESARRRQSFEKRDGVVEIEPRPAFERLENTPTCVLSRKSADSAFIC
jgi:hypothetical protein